MGLGLCGVRHERPPKERSTLWGINANEAHTFEVWVSLCSQILVSIKKQKSFKIIWRDGQPLSRPAQNHAVWKGTNMKFYITFTDECPNNWNDSELMESATKITKIIHAFTWKQGEKKAWRMADKMGLYYYSMSHKHASFAKLVKTIKEVVLLLLMGYNEDAINEGVVDLSGEGRDKYGR